MHNREAYINYNIEKSNYEKFAFEARLIIENLHKLFKTTEKNITTTNIVNNSFQIKFWGIEYIIKTEITYKDNKGFFLGEINTYLKNKTENILILSYSFDKIGNIQNDYLVSDFSDYYFLDFFKKIIEYSNSNNIKFQLI